MEQTIKILLSLTAGLTAGGLIGYRQRHHSHLSVTGSADISPLDSLDNDQRDLIAYCNAPARLPDPLIPVPVSPVNRQPCAEPPKDYSLQSLDIPESFYEQAAIDCAHRAL